MSEDLQHTSVIGGLARDPEVRTTASGMAVMSLRLAWTSRTKRDGVWGEKSNYIDAVMFGARAEALQNILGKGSRIAIVGRLDFQEWEAKDGGGRRSKLELIIDNLQLLDSRNDRAAQQPVAETDLPPAGTSGSGSLDDTDIPF